MTITVLCASMFDPLGHPLFANKISEHLGEHYKSQNIIIYGIASRSDDKSFSINKQILVSPIHCFTYGFTLENRRRLITRFGTVGLLYFFLIRFFVIIEFYLRSLKQSSGPIVDLELEPLQFALISNFIYLKSRFVGVTHSFPKHLGFSGKSLYKKLTAKILKNITKKNSNFVIGFMNEDALQNAINYGLLCQQTVLVGWGFNPQASSSRPRQSTDVVRLLSFGVIRHGKRLGDVVDICLQADDASIYYSIVGKSVDTASMEIKKQISTQRSNTYIEIQDRYVPEDEIQTLYNSHDILVLSHEEAFQSASGPMFLAMEMGIPILCFSKNFVREEVQATGIGLCYDLSTFDPQQLSEVLTRFSNLEQPDLTNHRYTWKNISKRVAESINDD